MRKLITALVITVLLIVLAPAMVYAAEGGVAAEAKGGNTAPEITALTLVEELSDTQVTALTPLTEYRVKATVSDINTIDDIETVEFHVYHATNGTKWDADECAIFLWTKSTGLWTMENDTAITTWAIVTGDCIAPSVFTGTTGDWYLAFEPGELAQADVAQNWHAWVRADDENKNNVGSTETLSSGATMGAYAEISLDAATIIFGDAVNGIEPGQTGYITSPNIYITTQVASNDIHDLGVRSDATWTNGGSSITLSGGTGVPGGDGEFSLEISDDGTGGDPGQPKLPSAVTATNATIAGHATDGRTETIDDGDEGTSDTALYMGLSLALTGVDEIVYSGTITFTVTN